MRTTSKQRRNLLPWLALTALAVHLAVSVPMALARSAMAARRMVDTRNESTRDSRVRTFGAGYVEAIEEIRRTIPEDGAYLLINGYPGQEEGGPLWAKFDLAPRRAVYLGSLRDLGNVDRMRRRMPRAARWVVIVHGNYAPPTLIEHHRFVDQMRDWDREPGRKPNLGPDRGPTRGLNREQPTHGS